MFVDKPLMLDGVRMETQCPNKFCHASEMQDNGSLLGQLESDDKPYLGRI